MSSRQDSDRLYEQVHTAWLAAQHGGSQLNFGGGFGGFEGARNGPRRGEFDFFNRSSIPLSGQPSSSTGSIDYVLHVVAQADYDTLLRSGNQAFAKALADHQGTKEELASLKRTFEVLVQTRTDSSLPSNADEGQASVSARRPSGIPRRRAYRREDVPLIKFWTRKEYEASKNKTSAQVVRNTKDSQLAFMEHEDGSAITEAEAAKMRETARGVFAQLLSEGNAPSKWGQVSIVSQDFFFNVLAERYPHSAMGEDMWKLQLLATLTYPSWYRNNKDKIEKPGFRPREVSKESAEKLEKLEQERIWIQQQLEHGRQLKEEVIEHVDEAHENLKRSRDPTEDPFARPGKKNKSPSAPTLHELIGTPALPSSVSGPLLAPQVPPEVFPMHSRKRTQMPHHAPRSLANQTTTRAPATTLHVSPTHANRSASTQMASSTSSIYASTDVKASPFYRPTYSRSSSNDPSISLVSFEATPDLAKQGTVLHASSNLEDQSTPKQSPSSAITLENRNDELHTDILLRTYEDPSLLHARGAQVLADSLSLDAGMQLETQDDLVASPCTRNPQLLTEMLSVDAGIQRDTHEDQSSQSFMNGPQRFMDASDASAPQLGPREDVPVQSVSQESEGLMEELFGLDVQADSREHNLTSLGVGTEFDSREDAPIQTLIRETQNSADSDPFLASSNNEHCGQEHDTTSPPTSSIQTTPSLALPADPSSFEAELLLSIGHVDRPSRQRPTPREHPAPPEAPDTLFDMNKQRVRTSTVKNPLMDLIQERIPSSNVTEALEPMYQKELPDSEENKENLGKGKGRGRPSDKDRDPEQLIKPTNASCTARNLFALEYKQKHHTNPTHRMWMELDKTEVDRFDALSREKGKEKKKTKAGAGNL